MLFILDIFGTIVFAISGSLAAGRKHLDLMGTIIVAMVTAVGGGTLRNIMLGLRPAWFEESYYIGVIVISAIFTFYYVRFGRIPEKALMVSDALGLAVFAITGAKLAGEAGASPSIMMMMGAMTGAAGGIIRDTLLNRIPMVFRREIYITAALAGAGLHILMQNFGFSDNLALWIPVLVVFIIRMAAIYFNLHMPAIILDDQEIES